MTRTHPLVLAAILVGALATGAAAATVTVTDVGRPGPGRLRIGVRYEAAGRPAFQMVRICPSLRPPRRTVAATWSVVPSRHQAFIELRDDFARLDPRRPCPVAGLAVELVQHGSVVARADVPSIPPVDVIAAPPPQLPSNLPSRLGFQGGKYLAPQTKMSQAGITWSLNNHLTLLLSYERTAYAPVMWRDHDDGVVTGLKLCF
jgi:hypothetical protein